MTSRIRKDTETPEWVEKPAPEPVWVPPWKRPGFRLAQREDLCTEEGCGKTVGQHIDETKALLERAVMRRP